MKELVALAKARPGDINYASGGVGSAQHIPMELLRSMTGIKVVHVAYKGDSRPRSTMCSPGRCR